VSEAEVLRLAGSLAQASQHVISHSLVEAARSKAIAIKAPAKVTEMAGEGLSGSVDRRLIILGHPDFVARQVGVNDLNFNERFLGSTQVAVGIDGTHAATLVFIDALRPDAESALAAFRRQGVKRIVLVTGDRAEIAEAVAQKLALDECFSGVSPEGKLEIVGQSAAAGRS
jgi:P-type E1-E2 ATPase